MRLPAPCASRRCDKKLYNRTVASMQEEEEENNPFSARNIERRVVHELNTNKATLIALGVALLKTAGKEITWRDVSTFMNALTIHGSTENAIL